MIVYMVVEDMGYDGQTNCAVFTNKEQAEQDATARYKALNPYNKRWTKYVVEEWEIQDV